MKTLNYTTTGSLFNQIGILTHAGDYAGEYEHEALCILSEDPDFKFSHLTDQWCDIMHNNRGECFAVYADNELTAFDVHCEYMKIIREDCPEAFDKAQTHLF